MFDALEPITISHGRSEKPSQAYCFFFSVVVVYLRHAFDATFGTVSCFFVDMEGFLNGDRMLFLDGLSPGFQGLFSCCLPSCGEHS